MARVFTITAPSSTITLDDQGQAEIAFTVVNATARRIRGRGVAVPQDASQKGWFTLAGETERDFQPGGTHQFAVRVAVPPGSKPGSYTFRLDAYSVQNPDEDHSQGPSVAFSVSAPEVKRFPWWMVAAAALVLVVGGVVAYVLLARKVKVPDVVGAERTKAIQVLQEAKLQVKEVTRSVSGKPEGAVLDQAPKAGDPVKKGTLVSIGVNELVKVPNVVGADLATAQTSLEKGRLRVEVSRVLSPRSQDTVLSQAPDPGDAVGSGSIVQLTVADSGTLVPDVVGFSRTRATQKIEQAKLQLREVTRSVLNEPPNNVLDQEPKEGVLVPHGTLIVIGVNELATVPAVVGSDLATSKATLENAKLRIGEISRVLSEKSRDTVLGQSPKAGETLQLNSAVHLTVADTGIAVPNVLGVAHRQAANAIGEAKLQVNVVTRSVSERPAGTVVDQEPRAGELVRPGSAVTIGVNDFVEVPNVVGSAFHVAQATLQGARLGTQVSSRELSEQQPQDTVLSQLPKFGETVKPGSIVHLTVADAATRVPNVIGSSRDGAIERLKEAKLQGVPVTKSLADKPNGVVLEQDHSAGQLVKLGTQVVISVNVLVSVPQVVGMDLASTRHTLAMAQLSLGHVATRVLDRGVAGQVLSQNPPPGNLVATGSAVQVETAQLRLGCDGVPGSGKIVDNCGVCGGGNACLRPCPAKFENLGNDYVFIYLDIPQTAVGHTISWSNVAVAKYVFPRCYRVKISDYSYSCERTPSGGVWVKRGDVARDALCHDEGSGNQPYMRTEKK